ncbi:helix-turn-helix domain-containing protein [Tuanshanicoccus lijuaniae]|uniref:helix-turn-helix domain-containing protein n=1 Tax=Aerococcaceae bacterium zg-1292 TaxID=2774330 RepID=UPI001934DC4D|nr:helix-turn-helix domain-containing protein [Aerococcaceae bacterium zg-1292]QQA36737.1 helix-turn-helix domain-containing protein [Aerococcaceae bacterium zg-1292]
MHIGVLIKKYREDHKLSMADFAKKATISKAYVSVLEKNKDPRNGKPIVPSLVTIQNVANGMDMTFDELFNLIADNELVSSSPVSTLTRINSTASQLNEDKQLVVLNTAEEQLDEQNKVRNLDEIRELYADYQTRYDDVNVYGSVSAGTGVEIYDKVVETVKAPAPVPSHDIALKVFGNSMAPLFQDGEVIFIRKKKEINHGQIGVFIVNGHGFVKKLYKGINEVKLISLHSNYKDIVLTEHDDIHVVGVVVM